MPQNLHKQQADGSRAMSVRPSIVGLAPCCANVRTLLQAHLPHLFHNSARQQLVERKGEVLVPTGAAYVPKVADGGAMAGVVYTVPSSSWHDSQALFGVWPPAHTGKQAVCLKWQAEIESGYLVMRQDDKNELRCA